MTGYQSKKLMAQSRNPEPDDLVKRLRALEQWLREPAEKNLTLSSDLFDEAADRIERQDEQIYKLRQRDDELWKTLIEIANVINGKEPDMNGRVWPLFITVVRDRIEALEAALRDIASGRYSGMMLTSLPPKDPAVERARAALAGEKKDGD